MTGMCHCRPGFVGLACNILDSRRRRRSALSLPRVILCIHISGSSKCSAKIAKQNSWVTFLRPHSTLAQLYTRAALSLYRRLSLVMIYIYIYNPMGELCARVCVLWFIRRCQIIFRETDSVGRKSKEKTYPSRNCCIQEFYSERESTKIFSHVARKRKIQEPSVHTAHAKKERSEQSKRHQIDTRTPNTIIRLSDCVYCWIWIRE